MTSLCKRCDSILDGFIDIAQAERRLVQGTLSPVDQRLITTGCLATLAGAIDELSDEEVLTLAHDEACPFRQAPLLDRQDPATDPEIDAIRWARHAYAHHVPFYRDREPFSPPEKGERKSYGPEHITAIFAAFGGHDPDTISEHDRTARSDMPYDSQLTANEGEPPQSLIFLKFRPWLSRLGRWRTLSSKRQAAVVDVLKPLMDKHVYVAIRHFREQIAHRIRKAHATA